MDTTERPAGRATTALLIAAHWAFAVLFLITFVLVLSSTLGALHLPGRPGLPEAVLVLTATGYTLFALSRQLAGQNVLLAAAIIALLGSSVQTLAVRTGIPFGPYIYTDSAGPRFFDTLPWFVPFLWIIVVLNSRGVARLILRPWRRVHNYGLRVLALTTGLCVAFDFNLEPFASRVEEDWLWRPTRLHWTWYHMPLTNLLGWVVTTLLILAFVTPALINKKPVKHPPDYHPLVVWTLLNALFVTGTGMHQLWLASAVGLAAILMVAIFALRGGRW